MIGHLSFLFGLFVFTSSALAGTYVCYSDLRSPGGPEVRFKVNPTKIKGRFILGVTLSSGERKVRRGNGNVSPNRISLNFVDQGWLKGYVIAQTRDDSEVMTGEAKISEVLGGQVYPISCSSFESEELLR